MAAKKSACKSVGRPFTGADDPRRGRGPRKGAANAGRPPDALVAMFKRLAYDPKNSRTLEKILEGDGTYVVPTKDGTKVVAVDLASYLKAHQYVTERAIGRVPEHLTLANDAEHPLIPASPLDEIRRAIARLAPSS